MLGGILLRSLMQAGYFLIVARLLGADGYGAFSGVIALAAILAPFSSMGSGAVLIKNVALDESRFHVYWGKALVITLVSGVGITLIIALVAGIFLPHTIRPALVIYVATADVLCARLLEVSGQAFQAFERMSRTAHLLVLSGLLRLCAGIAFWLVPLNRDPETWGALYMATSILGSIVAVALVTRELGRPRFAFDNLFQDIREGFHFATSLSAQSIYNDVDKTLLVRISGLNAAGIYSAAYRIVDVVFAPIGALLAASFTRFFKQGAYGARGAIRYASRLLPPSLLYALSAGAGLLLVAELLPGVLGSEFQESTTALRLLAIIPALKTFHYLAANALAGSGQQRARSYAQMAIAATNVLLCVSLIPRYSWRGAAWASIISDGLFAVLSWSLLYRYMRQADRAQPKGVLG